MDARDLKVFEAVARLGSMGRAAEELHTVQSNVTARIRSLEDQLGIPLFERHARGVAPTAAGHRLLPYAPRVSRLLDEARRAALDDGTPRGTLVVGSLETTAALHLTPALTRFAMSYPDVDLTLRPGTTCELLDQVLDGRLEGAFVCGPVAHPDLTAQTTFREELALLTAPAIRTIEGLDGQEVRIIVLRRGCSYRQRLEDVLARRGIPSPRVMEFGTLEAVIGCVAAGLGVTLLPRALLGPVWQPGRLGIHSIAPRDAMVETVFVTRRDGYISSALRAFLGTVQPVASARPIAAE